jgi:hypothetical protein
METVSKVPIRVTFQIEIDSKDSKSILEVSKLISTTLEDFFSIRTLQSEIRLGETPKKSKSSFQMTLFLIPKEIKQ